MKKVFFVSVGVHGMRQTEIDTKIKQVKETIESMGGNVKCITSINTSSMDTRPIGEFQYEDT